MSKHLTMKEIVSEILASPIGGDINKEASEIAGNSFTIHCWDGKRFKLVLSALEDGCCYDPSTGAKA